MGGSTTGTPITVTTSAIDTLTVLKIVTEALEELGLLAPGETASYDDVDFGIRKLNRMLNQWASEGVNIHYRAENTHTLVVADSSYTIGPSGADITTSRPQSIEQAFIRDSNGHDYEVRVRPISEYREISEKTSPGRPWWLFYDPTPSYGTIYLYPTPDTAETLYIYSQKPFTNVTAQEDEISLPPEYQNMIISNLAIQMAPAYGKSASNELVKMANDSFYSARARNIANSMKSVSVNVPGHRTTYVDIEEG